MVRGDLDRLNYMNIFLMVVSAVLGYQHPFEVFLIAYAVVGPLHFLTEMSWLHDRRYFTTGRFDWLLLALPAIPIALIDRTDIVPNGPWVTVTMSALFLGAAVMALAKNGGQKPIFFFWSVLLGSTLCFEPHLRLFFIFLLPSIVHVYFFTGMFIFHGAMKARLASGYLSFLVFIFLGIQFFVFRPPAAPTTVDPRVLAEASTFAYLLVQKLINGFHLEHDWDTVVAIMRFVTYIYLYHYLNWFSKTRVIGWHRVKVKRLLLIGSAYLLTLATLFIDYTTGMIVVCPLSMAHVFLEYPLDIRTMAAIGKDCGKLLRSMPQLSPRSLAQ
jgi:hypothetical protein